MTKSVIVIDESDSGRNLQFQDTKTGRHMTRAQFVDKIEEGKYEDYHVRKIHGVNTPVSDPDRSENNNLG
jgi:hypothetical protein